MGDPLSVMAGVMTGGLSTIASGVTDAFSAPSATSGPAAAAPDVSSSAGVPGANAQDKLANIVANLFNEATPVRQALLGQGLEAIQTGGIGAQIPLINQIVSATQQATQQRVGALQSAAGGYASAATSATGKYQTGLEQATNLYTSGLSQASNLYTGALSSTAANYIQALIDAANRGIEGVKSSTSQTLQDTQARLAQSGLAASPFGQNVLAATELGGRVQEANLRAQLGLQTAQITGTTNLATAQTVGQTGIQTAQAIGQTGIQTAALSGELDKYLAQLTGELGMTTTDITTAANLSLAQLPGQLALGFINQLPAFVTGQTQTATGGAQTNATVSGSMYGSNVGATATTFASANDAYGRILSSLIGGVSGIGASAAGK